MFEILPAIDIKGGKCVRLLQGKSDQEIVYSNDPVKIAVTWVAKGAKRLHVVDLDGAFKGCPVNLSVISRIVEQVRVPVQLGGGLRSTEDITRAFDLGVERVVLSTAALTEPGFLETITAEWPGRVTVSLDFKGELLAVSGWEQVASVDPDEVVLKLIEFQKQKMPAVILTDVRKDGTLTEPNYELVKRVCGRGLKVIVAGGIRHLEHVRALAEIPGVDGVILGRAIYEGIIDISQLLQ